MTCHIRATCHTVRWRNFICHIENRCSPYFIFAIAVWVSASGGFRIVSDTLVNLFHRRTVFKRSNSRRKSVAFNAAVGSSDRSNSPLATGVYDDVELRTNVKINDASISRRHTVSTSSLTQEHHRRLPVSVLRHNSYTSLQDSSAGLDIPRARRTTIGDCAFCVAGRRVWNSLSSSSQNVLSLLVFRRLLKCELFRRCYDLC